MSLCFSVAENPGTFNKSSANVSHVAGINVINNTCGKKISRMLTNMGLGDHGFEDELDIMAYNLNDSSLIGKIIDAAERGVQVRILLNQGAFGDSRRSIKRYNTETLPADKTGRLKPIHVRTLKGGGSYGVMHHKVMLMRMAHRRNTVFFGSFNFSNNAAKYNYENCAQAQHPYNTPAGDQVRTLFDRFNVEFERLWGLGSSAR